MIGASVTLNGAIASDVMDESMVVTGSVVKEPMELRETTVNLYGIFDNPVST
jgi:predicted RNA-binding protein